MNKSAAFIKTDSRCLGHTRIPSKTAIVPPHNVVLAWSACFWRKYAMAVAKPATVAPDEQVRDHTWKDAPCCWYVCSTSNIEIDTCWNQSMFKTRGHHLYLSCPASMLTCQEGGRPPRPCPRCCTPGGACPPRWSYRDLTILPILPWTAVTEREGQKDREGKDERERGVGVRQCRENRQTYKQRRLGAFSRSVFIGMAELRRFGAWFSDFASMLLAK